MAGQLGSPAPARQGVDIYNAVGTTSRLIAFMKIGASPRDLQYLVYLNARLNNQSLPKAYLAGSVIYFRGVDEPLKVLDVRNKLFSYRGKRIDLALPGGIASNLAALERALTARSAGYFFLDWIFPEAMATGNIEPGAAGAAILAVGGLTTNMQCLSERGGKCSHQFMGTLGVIGAVGGLSGQVPSTQVFCSRGMGGENKFVIAGQAKSVRAISQGDGEYVISPGDTSLSSIRAQNAAVELLGACSSKQELNSVNIALAYPSSPEEPMLPARQVATQPVYVPAQLLVPARAPAPNRAPASVEPALGDAAR